VDPYVRRAKRQACTGHYDAVRKYIAKERLLECGVKGGWGSLCGFLRMEMLRDGVLYGNDIEVQGDEDGEVL
jgi:hypothetical protein